MPFKLSIVLMCFAIALAGLPQTAHAQSMAATAALNVRTGPGLDRDIVAVLFSGERVMVGTCSGEWCHITHSGPDGWVYAPYLIPGITTETIHVSSRDTGAAYLDAAASAAPDIGVNLDLSAPAPRRCPPHAFCH